MPSNVLVVVGVFALATVLGVLWVLLWAHYHTTRRRLATDSQPAGPTVACPECGQLSSNHTEGHDGVLFTCPYGHRWQAYGGGA